MLFKGFVHRNARRHQTTTVNINRLTAVFFIAVKQAWSLWYHGAMKQWYLIYTKPRQELIAVANLQNQAYNAFAPQVSVKKRTNQGWKQVNEPLFPNYVFIQLDDVADDWKPIRSTRGVSGFVRFGSGVPAPIVMR